MITTYHNLLPEFWQKKQQWCRSLPIYIAGFGHISATSSYGSYRQLRKELWYSIHGLHLWSLVGRRVTMWIHALVLLRKFGNIWLAFMTAWTKCIPVSGNFIQLAIYIYMYINYIYIYIYLIECRFYILYVLLSNI